MTTTRHQAKIETRSLTVSFDEKRVLTPIDVSIAAHGVTALIGPSGCGKSTFLRALNRMHDTVERAEVSGEVLLDGEDIYHRDVDPVAVRRRVGMVFQRPNPLPGSIFDNVAFGLRVAGHTAPQAIPERVERALRRAALWSEVKDRLRAPASALSGGQQQRLCIARAIAIEPDVLLMDEPCSALDPIATEHVEALITELKARYTVVLVTHSLAQARRVSDHTAFFYLGALVEFGPSERVLLAPDDERTRSYVRGAIG
ncbi:MAG: phosphate ABC transporter ATP-binding protein [Myxococcales bacterium]|nr:phosphate ABC transporter ATP-binding protein [Myxococcales bacterium]